MRLESGLPMFIFVDETESVALPKILFDPTKVMNQLAEDKKFVLLYENSFSVEFQTEHILLVTERW